MTQAATDVLGVAREQVLERGEGLSQHRRGVFESCRITHFKKV